MARTGLKGRGARFRSGMIGVAILVAMGFAVYVALNAQKGLPFTDHGFYKVAMNDIGDLRVGNDVRIAQVRVGRVDDVQLVDGQALVRMQIDDPDTQLYRDARAEVTSRSGLGQKYLDIEPGTPGAGELAQDAVMSVEQTEEATQLLDLMQVFDPETQAAAQNALQELGGGAAGRGEDLRDFTSVAPELLPDLGTVSSSLAADDGRDLTSMLRSLESLGSRFVDRQQEITELEDQLATTLAAFNADGGAPLSETLDVAPEALANTRTALVDLQDPLRSTTSALTALEEGAESLGAATPDLRGFLRESPQPLDRVPSVSDSAEPALAELTETVVDARPFAAKTTELVNDAASPLQTLAPYSPEIAQWFTNAGFALSDGDVDGHWLRFTLLPRTESLSGGAGMEDPLRQGDAYPEPGEVPGQRGTPFDGTPLENLTPRGDR